MITSARALVMTTPVEKQPQSSILSMLSSGLGCTNFTGITFGKIEGKEQNAGIIGAKYT